MNDKMILITQSNYIPWKGYFDLINVSDEFVIYDDMQFTKRDWRNRNKIKTAQGLHWLTVPVRVKGKFDQKIRETEIVDDGWAETHWKTIKQSYAKAPYFSQYAELIEPIYLKQKFRFLSDLNFAFIEAICGALGIKTNFRWSSDFALAEERTERLVNICCELGGTHYITGPAAKAYMNESHFADRGIQLNYFDYTGYTPYNQLFGDFAHDVSIIDLLFNAGDKARLYLKTTQTAEESQMAGEASKAVKTLVGK